MCVFAVFLLRRRLRSRLAQPGNGDWGWVPRGFTWLRRRADASTDRVSKIWGGDTSARSASESSKGGQAPGPYAMSAVDHDGSTVRGERLALVRKSLLRDSIRPPWRSEDGLYRPSSMAGERPSFGSDDWEKRMSTSEEKLVPRSQGARQSSFSGSGRTSILYLWSR